MSGSEGNRTARSKIAPSSTVPLPGRGSGWFELAYAVTLDGRLACLDTNRDMLALGDEPSPKPMSTTGRLTSFDGEWRGNQTHFPLEFDYPAFDELPGGGWIVADARCRQGQDNARHLAEDGTVLRHLCLGDAIEHLQCDDEGRIWCGYWDEGALINRAWGRGGPGMPASGLMRFDTDGTALWSQGMARAGLPMVDCYALNVGRREIWSCYYTDFPLLRVDGSGHCQLWSNEISGVKAVAIDRHLGLLIGGYGEDSHRITLFRRGGHEITLLATFDLDLGYSREKPARLFAARHDMLHVVWNEQWHRLSVMDVALAAGVYY